jgi:DNA-3-methyladenine glycosylase I
VRNRLKVEATVGNARALLKMRDAGIGFSDYLWRYLDGEPVVNHFTTLSQVPAFTPVSDAMSRDLKKRGFRFVGSTICYAFMQAVGMVNDHLTGCPRHREIQLRATCGKEE